MGKEIVSIEHIESKILFIRGQKMMLDADLAFLYGVETRVLIQAVKRNIGRFPQDFVFQLSKVECEFLRSQFVISKPPIGRGGRRYLPYAFTEQGVAMLSSVLKSPRAIMVNVEIMRAFVRLRRIMVAHADLARKLDKLEKKYNRKFAVVFEAIRQLMAPTEPEPPPRRRIGFTAQEKSGRYSIGRKR